MWVEQLAIASTIKFTHLSGTPALDTGAFSLSPVLCHGVSHSAHASVRPVARLQAQHSKQAEHVQTKDRPVHSCSTICSEQLNSAGVTWQFADVRC